MSASRQQIAIPNQNVVLFLGGGLSFSGSGRPSLWCFCMHHSSLVWQQRARPSLEQRKRSEASVPAIYVLLGTVVQRGRNTTSC